MRLSACVLLVSLLSAAGCGGDAVNPAPPNYSLQLLAMSTDTLAAKGFAGSFDASGRIVEFGDGVRRYDPDRGGYEALGADLGFGRDGFGTVAADGTIYHRGYRLDPATGFWSLLPSVSGDPLALPDPDAATAFGDEGGNLYAVHGGKVYRLPAGGAAWEAVALPGPAVVTSLAPSPTGHGVVTAPYLIEGSGPATLLPGGVVATGYDADGTGWYVTGGTLFKVSPDGTKTQVRTLTNPLGTRLESVDARDAKGRFYATALSEDGASKHLLRLGDGASVWEDLATTIDVYDFIRVRSDGLVVVFSSPNLGVLFQYRYEVYGTGDTSLLPDAREPGVHFNPAAVTLLPGASVKLGLSLRGVSSLDGLSVTAGPGLTAKQQVALSVHGAAGALTVTAAANAAPGAAQVTVRSPSGDQATLTVTIAAPGRPSGPHRAARTLAAGNVMLAVRSDGTVYTWPGARDDTNPTGAASRVPVVSGARSVALDSTGTGPAYAVRSDGQVWAWSTARPDRTPFLVAGLASIAVVAAGKDEALALDESGQVWAWKANGNLGQPAAAPQKVSALTGVVALAPGFFALQQDGTLLRWDDTVTPPAVAPVQGLPAVADVAPGFVVGADGSLFKTANAVDFPDFVARNGYLSAGIAEYTYPFTASQYRAVSAALALRSDWTAWEQTLRYDVGSPVPARHPQQVGPAHVTAVATTGYANVLLLADGTVYQARAIDSLQGVSAYLKVPALDGVLQPQGDVPPPDFDLFVPEVATVTAGATLDVPATVVRLRGFTGELSVTATSLPAGVTLAPLTIPAADQAAVLHFTAAAGVRFSYTPVQLQTTGGGLTRLATLTLHTILSVHLPHPTLVVAGSHGAAVKSDGTVLTWGSNGHGELGQGTTDDLAHGQAAAVPGLTHIVAVAAGYKHTLALDDSGKVYAWGDNSAGQGGPTGTTTNLKPTVVAGLPPAKGVAASGDTSLVLARDGSVWAFAPVRQLDEGPYPALWFDFPNTSFVGITAGGGIKAPPVSDLASCVSNDPRVVTGAGGPPYPVLLREDYTVGSACGPAARPGFGDILAVTAYAVLHLDGTVTTFDDSRFLNPKPVPGISDAVDLATAIYGADPTEVILRADGTVWAFGANLKGEAGAPVPASTHTLAPQPIPGLTGVKLP